MVGLILPDFCLFHFQKNYLNGKTFANEDALLKDGKKERP